MSTHEDSDLTTRGRVTSLAIGIVYLMMATKFFSVVTGASLSITAIFVVAGAAGIIISLAVFCVKFLSTPPGTRRVRLSTLILLFMPLSIYLAAVSRIIETFPKGEVPIVGWFVLAAVFVFFIVATTAILLRFGEALVWLALHFRRP
jgi:hypothetical protein